LIATLNNNASGKIVGANVLEALMKIKEKGKVKTREKAGTNTNKVANMDKSPKSDPAPVEF